MHISIACTSLSCIRGPLARVAIAIVLLGVAPVSAADDTAAGQSGAAMRMYRDPDSGRIGAPPAAAFVGGAEPAQPNAAEDLASEPVTAPAGGVKVNLRGRFQAAVQRHVGVSGPAAHSCVQAGADTHE